MRVFIIIFIVLFSTNAYSEIFKSFNEETIARETIFLYSLAKDWKQTHNIIESPFRREGNKFLGPDPSREKVDTYFASCAVIHSTIAFMLPEKYSKMWQMTWIFIQTGVTERNESERHNITDMSFRYKIEYTINF